MNLKIEINFDTDRILKVRGLGKSDGAQKYLASEVARFCDPYVPMEQGMLKNQYTIASDGSELTYTQPYAHYQYYGKAMAGRAPKSYTGADLTYNGAPMRGAQWDKRMLADRKQDLVSSLEAYIAEKRG